MKYCLLLTCLLIVKPSRGGLLLWAQQSIEIPALKHFNNTDLLELTRVLKYPKIIAFQTELLGNASYCFNNMHSAYVPSSDLDFKDINGVNTTVFSDITELLKSCNTKENVLLLQLLPNVRSKREVETMKNGMQSSESSYESPKGPILYSAEGTTMIYTAQPPLLKINGDYLTLGKSVNTILVKSDRNNSSKLIVTIPVADSKKIILRFRFSSYNGYWSLTAVQVDVDGKIYDLNITKVVEAPRHFSYHCFAETVFRDATNKVELILYALQAQPDSKNNRFSDAVDCVPFVTAPILSGLFIAFTLIIGLFIGLGALGSIKPMDKFDNCKTKQLSIALAD